MSDVTTKDAFYKSIKTILQSARDRAYTQVNFIMVEAYWNIGKQIVQEEQQGEDKAKYGTYLIKGLSQKLTADFGKGFSQQSIRNMRQFFIVFPIRSTLCSELSSSSYHFLIYLENENKQLI